MELEATPVTVSYLFWFPFKVSLSTHWPLELPPPSFVSTNSCVGPTFEHNLDCTLNILANCSVIYLYLYTSGQYWYYTWVATLSWLPMASLCTHCGFVWSANEQPVTLAITGCSLALTNGTDSQTARQLPIEGHCLLYTTNRWLCQIFWFAEILVITLLLDLNCTAKCRQAIPLMCKHYIHKYLISAN